MAAMGLQMNRTFVDEIFYEEPAGTFEDGHLLVSEPDLASAQQDPDVGYWHCDIAAHDRLTWSEKVYDLFGLQTGIPIERDWAVSRYDRDSQNALRRIRAFALNRGFGFILDAAIRPEGTPGDRRIRVVAAPILTDGRLVGLHGLKRAL